MKTETAEGMMCGSTILGTAESFIGYELDFGKIGALCETADEFVAAIGRFAENRPAVKFNCYSRSQFLDKYESRGSLERFRSLFSAL